MYFQQRPKNSGFFNHPYFFQSNCFQECMRSCAQIYSPTFSPAFKGVSATLVLEHFSPKKKRLLASLFERFFFRKINILFFHLGTLYFSEHCNCSPQKNSPEGKKKVTGVLRTNHHQQEGTILLRRRCKRVFTLIMP